MISVLIILLIVMLLGLMLKLIWRKSHRCRYCQCDTFKLKRLPEEDCELAIAVISGEGMGNFDLSSYDVCLKCRRIYDWRWFNDDRLFRRDWDMYDRQCRCGSDLRRPHVSYFPSGAIREAITRMRPEAVGRIRLAYSPEHIAAANTDITLEDHIYFLCLGCWRIYMWMPVGSFQVFQCVTKGSSPYDGGPTGKESHFDRVH